MRSWLHTLLAVSAAAIAGLGALAPAAAEPTPVTDAALVSAAGDTASADDRSDRDLCRPLDEKGRPIVACFDIGNRLILDVGSDGAGGALALRHEIETDEADAIWRLEHTLLSARSDGQRLSGSVYAGRYLRHARDGRIVLPPWPQRKLFIPFDLGAEAELGRVDMRFDDDAVDLGAVRAALLIELTRSPHHRRRLAIGAVASWDLALDRDRRRVLEHRVAPLSRGLIDGYIESRDGLTSASARVEAGTAWSHIVGWRSDAVAEARIERIFMALNDRPLSVYARGRYRHDLTGNQGSFDGTVGLRFSLMLAPPPIGDKPTGAARR